MLRNMNYRNTSLDSSEVKSSLLKKKRNQWFITSAHDAHYGAQAKQNSLS